MIRIPGVSHPLLLWSLFSLALASGYAAGDQKAFSTSQTLSQEASTLVRLMEQAHYNHDAVRASDYAEVIPDYMSDLDGQRLFFLGSDRAAFMERFGKNVYYNTAFLGNIDAAYEMFYVYQTRVGSRIAWIFKVLEEDFDLTADEVYGADRSKAEWPATTDEADDLWRKRLKFELVGELLNKKSLDEAKAAVRKRYERMLKNLGEIEGTDLAELFLSNIARLYDPHSTYFSSATFEDFGIQMKLQLVGIGALLGLEEDLCVVKEIIPGGPADLGRTLKPNDKIIAVGQPGAEPVEIIGMKLRKIVDMIRGPKGTQVHLIVQPADATDASSRHRVTITRDVVKLNSARARAGVFQVPDAEGRNQNVGVITLPAFYGPAEEGDTDGERTSASKDVARLIERLKAEGIEGMVLDLRRNGGGYLSEAIELAGLFIHKGPVVQVKNFNGDTQVDSDTSARIAYEGPLAVLVDRFSASASEIVAGALQDYGRAIVIGDSSTHGKGSVQQVVEMKQLSRALALSPAKTGAAKFTIQKYYLPSGASTQLKGVVPDIVLPSIDDFLPIGEADLPRALVWDQISSSTFAGSRLDPAVLAPLLESSRRRQAEFEEFAYLRKHVEWFKSRQEQKLISVNLAERERQKVEDDQFRKQMQWQRELLAQGDFTYKPFHLGTPPTPGIRAPRNEEDEDEGFDFDSEAPQTYARADIHLRESLRVVADAIALGRNRELWASTRKPLTAATGG